MCCPAAIYLTLDHAAHLLGCVLRGELSVAYFALLVALILLVAIGLASEMVAIGQWLRAEKPWRSIVDWLRRFLA